MELYYWRGAVRNFGDELNTLLWPRLLPGLFDDDAGCRFLGIGSVLDARHPAAATKVVAGAGYGGYARPPKLDGRWVIHWVRGPRTARLLGLPAALGLGDPAELLPLAGWHRTSPGAGSIGFMPHFESLAHGAWPAAAASAGVTLIDPRDEPAAVIDAIGRCRVLLSEAMHGAIVADTLRVPWIALRPLVALHRAKWQDWADVLELRIAFQGMAASALLEWLHASRLANWHQGRRLLRLAGPALDHCRFVDAAAAILRRAASAPAQLSADAALDRSQTHMFERLDALRRDPLRPHPDAISMTRRR